MVSSFPKMQKSSASFSQSVRNRLRLKKLQAQAKNFCRVLDIRVPEIMKPNFPQTVLFNDPREVFRHIVGAQEFTALVNTDVVEVVSTVRFLEETPVHFLLFLFL